MAKIKKLQESGATIYPATIMDAVKDSDSQKTLPEVLDDLKEGNYPKMSVGFAENIVGDGTATEEEFSFRPTAGVDRNVETTTYDYDMRSNFGARIESVKGNSVVWNQLLGITSILNIPEGLTVTLNEDGSVTINGTVTEKSFFVYNAPFRILSGHKYLLTSSNNASNTYLQVPSSITTNFGEGFVTANGNENMNYTRQVVSAGVTLSNEVVRPRIYDLTQMFGAGNEPTTIEEFYARLPKNVDLNAYNVGETVDAHYGAIKTTGLNQWDEQWEVGNINTSTGLPSISSTTCRSKNFTRVLGGCEYAFTMGNTTSGIRLFQYNDSYEMVGVNTLNTANSGNADFYRVTLLADTKYIKIVCLYSATYLNDICINIAWDEYSSMNGTYAPYKPFVRDLSWISKYFTEGKMRRAGSVSDEIRFNSTTQKWEAVRRVGVVDLGTLNWDAMNSGTSGVWVMMASFNLHATANNIISNITTERYIPASADNVYILSTDKTIAGAYNSYGNYISVYDSDYTTSADVADFKASLQGVMLNYELVEPIVTEIEEIPSLDFDVADYGTEELIVADGVKSAPFLGNIIYTPNALKTLEQVPDILRRLAALENA